MNDKINKNNISQRNNELETKEGKIWLGDDGIVRVKAERVMNEKIIERLVRSFREIAKELPTKPKILVDISVSPYAPGSLFRKNVVRILKDAIKDPGFEKLAMWGGGVLQRVSVSFILTASRLKNIKYFKTEEEAFKWFKEE